MLEFASLFDLVSTEKNDKTEDYLKDSIYSFLVDVRQSIMTFESEIKIRVFDVLANCLKQRYDMLAGKENYDIHLQADAESEDDQNSQVCRQSFSQLTRIYAFVLVYVYDNQPKVFERHRTLSNSIDFINLTTLPHFLKSGRAPKSLLQDGLETLCDASTYPQAAADQLCYTRLFYGQVLEFYGAL